MPGRFQYEGALEKTPLAEVLTTVLRHRVPGRLEVALEDVTKHIWIAEGLAVAAASDDRADRLGASLYRMGRLTLDQLESIARDKDETGRKVGRILIERGILTPRELHDALCEQMKSVIWSVFRWSTGRVRFEIGTGLESGRVRIHLPLRQVILQGLQEVPDQNTKELVARLGRRATVFRPSWSTEDVVDLALDREQMDLLRLVDGHSPLSRLCDEGPGERAQNARLLYAFRLLGLIAPVSEPASGALKIRLPADRSPAPEV
jgi:hypothetical protein